MNLNIAGFDIKLDSNGRYCLNDFHKAAGGEAKHTPGRFTITEGFQALVEELIRDSGLAPVVSQRGGSTPGTFVCKELVYAYAMWVSPKFHLHVIRTYDQAVLAEMAEHRRVTSMALQTVVVYFPRTPR